MSPEEFEILPQFPQSDFVPSEESEYFDSDERSGHPANFSATSAFDPLPTRPSLLSFELLPNSILLVPTYYSVLPPGYSYLLQPIFGLSSELAEYEYSEVDSTSFETSTVLQRALYPHSFPFRLSMALIAPS
ncbi:hypothetical protein PIB30_039480 [Stylosanthes scabra]|uniref:Uncharacterized protein n=1 Tax=Stylosanthes scabra TaxID=79078 RepID=A0ABU6XCD0_9FABA|nr:hypothetical protein [Stylosanthes scabra]